MTTNYLPNPIALPSGTIIKLEVVPIPKPDADSRHKPRRDCSINVGLFCGGKLIELRPISTAVCDEPEVELADGSKLGEVDIETLNSEGWDQLLDLGVVLTELVLRIPRQPAMSDMKKESVMALFLYSQKDCQCTHTCRW